MNTNRTFIAKKKLLPLVLAICTLTENDAATGIRVAAKDIDQILHERSSDARGPRTPGLDT